MAYVDIETPEGARRILLERDKLSIGRLSYNDVVLPSAQISRQHAELRCVNGKWWIADLQSTNGLHINGQRVQQHQLADGDRVLLAPEISIRFLDGLASAPEQAPAAPPLNTPRPPLGPRSPFADDEEPYFPPGMAFIPAPSPRIPTPPPGTERAPAPYIPMQSPPRSTMPAPPSSVGLGGSADGHPASTPAGLDAVLRDPFRRSSPGSSGSRPTSGPGSTLLHVCQTCSQLTAPDAVYCQNCHHSIAYECPKCRLPLLPINDRCP
ncbi:MAG TPA: FHA domain-containing protein, partial [Ktedonobacterales bacterium]|nr:FHA domain-containing protein [Ktedonobacterales bacterium]